MPDPLIDFASVSLTLGDGATRVEVLRDLTFAIASGESVAIVGPSGSGKTSLLSLLAGLDRPTDGVVTVAGQNFGRLTEDELARFRGRHIGIVFQNFHLVPTMTALENVAAPLELAANRDARTIARERLAEVGLGERLSHYPSQLSGGEQQRVAIARALAREPALVIADEPTGNLDETTGAQVVELLFTVRRPLGSTLILVTHDTNLAKRCDRTLLLRAGQIVQVDAAEAKALSA